MVYRWEDCPVLAGLDLGTYTQFWDLEQTPVDSQTAITAYLTSKKAGDTVTLEVYNGLSQQTFTAEVTLAESTGE